MHFANCQGADTVGKVAFSGSKIVIETRFAGPKDWGRDTNITLTDVATGIDLRFGDTNYAGWGVYLAQYKNGVAEYFRTQYGGSTNAFKEYRFTVEGTRVTIERGDSLANITETHVETLPRSATGSVYTLQIGTGGCDGYYSPADFDWIRVY